MRSFKQHLEEKFKKLDFDDSYWFIPNRVYEHVDIDVKIHKLYQHLHRLRKIRFDQEEIEMMMYYYYIRETWLVETASKMDSLDIICMLKERQLDNTKVREFQKLVNLERACNLFLHNNKVSHFSVSLAKQVHKIIGKNIIDNSGSYRRINVCATKCSVIYCSYEQIEERMNILFEFIYNEKMKLLEHNKDEMLFKRAVLLGAFFFSEFLLIHPFTNGNGRTIRILTTILLEDIIYIPFSLYYDDSREMYLKVLDARNDPDTPPSAIALYMLLCIEKWLGEYQYLTC